LVLHPPFGSPLIFPSHFSVSAIPPSVFFWSIVLSVGFQCSLFSSQAPFENLTFFLCALLSPVLRSHAGSSHSCVDRLIGIIRRVSIRFPFPVRCTIIHGPPNDRFPSPPPPPKNSDPIQIVSTAVLFHLIRPCGIHLPNLTYQALFLWFGLLVWGGVGGFWCGVRPQFIFVWRIFWSYPSSPLGPLFFLPRVHVPFSPVLRATFLFSLPVIRHGSSDIYQVARQFRN